MPGISVALPVGGALPAGADYLAIAAQLEQALRCILCQSLRDLDVMVILNGADPHLHALVRTLAFRDSRIRMLELPEPNLAAALNHALANAHHDLVARMDADDLCDSKRLEKQAAFMIRHPDLAAVGCAWELIDGAGNTVTVVRPPTEPGHLRWRLLLGNWLAHGSMMLHREAVLAAGGYDAACMRSQDYDLWLRLAWPEMSGPPQTRRPAARIGIACLPEVLYRYRTRYPGDPGRATPQQAAFAAPVMLRAWQHLAALEPADEAELAEAMSAAISRHDGPDVSTAALENMLAAKPSREAFAAWLWAQWHHPPMHRRALETCRLSRLREVGEELRREGIAGIHLWGAGDHTRCILEHSEALGLPILGIVDDRAGEGNSRSADPQTQMKIRPLAPSSLGAGDCVLISSDWYEDQIWASSEPHRERGVRVWRLYG